MDSLRGQTLTFPPVATLGAGDKVQWKINVRAKKIGDARFGVFMITDQLKTKVQETEATTIY
jgi:hypothetical protein